MQQSVHSHQKEGMKISNIFTACLWIILTTNIKCNIVIRRDKRSVFDMISNIDEGNMNEISNKHSIVLSKVISDNKPIKYQDLRNIFNQNKNEEKQIAINKRRKEGVKKQFLVKSHRRNKESFDKRKHEHIIVNFSFLTKMS